MPGPSAQKGRRQDYHPVEGLRFRVGCEVLGLVSRDTAKADLRFELSLGNSYFPRRSQKKRSRNETLGYLWHRYKGVGLGWLRPAPQ